MNNAFDLNLKTLPHGKNILIIDDQPSSIVPVKFVIENLGHRVSVAIDAYSALQNIQSRDFELIVLDWIFPDMEGHTILKTLDGYFRLKPRWTVPYVVYSGLAPHEIALPETRALRFVEYWEKPFSLLAMTVRANRVINHLRK